MGSPHVPRKGPAILAANHESFLDPPLLGASVRRQVTFLAMRPALEVPVSGWMAARLGTVPVELDRVDPTAMRRCLEVLGRGGVVGVFPEGTRNQGPLLPFREGLGFLARRARVPVVPAAMVGTALALPRDARLPRPRRVEVRFGEAIEPADPSTGRRRTRAEITARTRAAIEALLGGGGGVARGRDEDADSATRH